MPSSSNIVVLPSIRTLFPNEAFESLPSYSSGVTPPPLKQKQQSTMGPYLQLPLPTPRHIHQDRRASITSRISSAPSLSFSPSPSPSPSPILSPPKGSRNRVRLVPCSIDKAEAVVVTESDAPSKSNGNGRQTTLLVGPAMAQAIKERRKVYPYRVARC